VVGYSEVSNGVLHTFLYDPAGAKTDLGTLGGTNSYGYAINAAGQVAGYSLTTANAGERAFLYSPSAGMVDLGTLGGSGSRGFGLNASGQVTGASNVASGFLHAFVYKNGAMTDLGALGGGTSLGSAINASGQVTGYANISTLNGYQHAFLYSNGSMTDLGALSGNYSSAGWGINTAGQVTGSSSALAIGVMSHGFLYSNGAMVDLNSLNGVAGNGLTLSEGRGINDAGQIVGTAVNASGTNRGFVLTQDTTVWEGGSTGSFSSSSGWSFLTAPNKNTAVFIDPTVSATITGPSVNTTVKQLTIGGDGTGNNGIATLALAGATLTVVDSTGVYTTINANGVLTGDGTLNGYVRNSGTVNAVNLTLPGGMVNYGTVTGNGRLNTTLNNVNSGLLRAGAGQVLMLSGSSHQNSAAVEVRSGGELQVSGAFTNVGNTSAALVVDNSTARFTNGFFNNFGKISLFNATAVFSTGLANGGQLQIGFGGANIFGPVTNYPTGKIIVSGNSNTTFNDKVEVQSGGELRVSTGSVATFFGQVFQRTGALFTGTGTKFYEGGLTIGGSPGLAVDGGDVNFGAGNVFMVDIGGTTPCTADCATNEALKNSSYDKYVVTGHLGLGGTLKLGSWNGFTPQAGQSFDLLDWGSASGSFDSIDASALLLPAGLGLDTSHLALDGSVSVVAVPEPETWALMLAGMGLGGWAKRRGTRH
jgi:probable HAF family extracellular repeat protein